MSSSEQPVGEVQVHPQPAPPGSGPWARFVTWAGQDTIEDYSLRYAPKSFRKWSPMACAITALGGIAYLADYSIGASIAVSHGSASAVVAIIVAAVTIFLTGIPIAYYAAKYNIDMDLLTRGAGFGYFGSTLTSLIYASFCFIFFALEGSIMAQAMKLALHIPLALGYVLGSLIIIPLVLYGMTALAKFQVWTQPLWLVLFVAPIVFIATADPKGFNGFLTWAGDGGTERVTAIGVGAGAGVALSLIAQIGEQVDYLRFMPEKSETPPWRWWSAVLAAGPGWVILGAAKQICGAFLAFYVAGKVGFTAATEPIQQFLGGFGSVLHNDTVALAVATIMVLLSQVKINVTNAYSGSLSWSNFFSRVLHIHPGRVVWLGLHIAIALALMLGNMFAVLNTILGFYSNVAIAWIGAIVADLVINKPLLKLSPSYVEFKRAYLYSINPVGFVSMMVGSFFSILAFYNVFGDFMAAWSPYLALALAFFLSPVICILTKGKYYLVRPNPIREEIEKEPLWAGQTLLDIVDQKRYELPDMVHDCPFHGGTISSLTCTLTKCHDLCKTSAYIDSVTTATLRNAAEPQPTT
ncbi:allantoin permease [Mycolicibacterium madagascariense]|uniref:Allantoin permease n=1 Tax=Mycolicibacterium madagascariense TaxID=212765 RepID=A0A7I7X9Z8_9MYCO|nr:cytosine permease [Mycolicibacterium madagascariense]MCV7012921.1 cytosine permease [Mycolicibacterium madagascariense]BBZ26170.1 allantoin permease [Mycolicibacterium madagascariense]